MSDLRRLCQETGIGHRAAIAQVQEWCIAPRVGSEQGIVKRVGHVLPFRSRRVGACFRQRGDLGTGNDFAFGRKVFVVYRDLREIIKIIHHNTARLCLPVVG